MSDRISFFPHPPSPASPSLCHTSVQANAVWELEDPCRSSKSKFLVLWNLKSESESEVTQSCSTLSTPWTVTYQAPQSMEFSRQEYWSGLPFHSPGDLPNPGIKSGSPALQADALSSKPPGKPSVEIMY